MNALPSSPRYSRSLMHKDQLSFVTITPHTDFLITSSLDGVVKFWKKMAMGVEFVKEFRVHDGEIRGSSASADGRSFATAGADNTVKIFDVITFGTITAAASLGHESRVNEMTRSLDNADIAIYTTLCLLDIWARGIFALTRRD